MGKNVISMPAFGEILTARPDGMDYGEYRDRLRAQCRRLKRRLRGVWVWKRWVRPGCGEIDRVQGRELGYGDG